MRRQAIVAILAVSMFGGVSLMAGCEKTTEKETSTETKPNGQTVEKAHEVEHNTVTGTTKETTETHVTPATNPAK